MKNLTVEIHGSPGSGKTTIAHLMKMLLSLHGAKVKIQDDSDPDTDAVLRRIKSLEGKEITIIAQQSSRNAR